MACTQTDDVITFSVYRRGILKTIPQEWKQLHMWWFSVVIFLFFWHRSWSVKYPLQTFQMKLYKKLLLDLSLMAELTNTLLLWFYVCYCCFINHLLHIEVQLFLFVSCLLVYVFQGESIVKFVIFFFSSRHFKNGL